MVFGSKSSMNDDWDLEDEPDIFARVYYVEKDLEALKKVQEEHALLFGLLMKKYNVTVDEIRAVGKTLC